MKIQNNFLILTIISLSLFIETYDATSINIAIPNIAAYLHEDPLNLKLVLSSYFISFAMFI
ncbi:MAG: hypothetical protein Q8L68_01555, partial [Methylococcales bacterium]|nr:hypothetical protein [Methylococcales bacterium]